MFDAIEEISNFLEECQSSGDCKLFIIHGYRNGQILKNYIRSKKFLEDMANEGFQLKELNQPNPGVSVFKLIQSN